MYLLNESPHCAAVHITELARFVVGVYVPLALFAECLLLGHGFIPNASRRSRYFCRITARYSWAFSRAQTCAICDIASRQSQVLGGFSNRRADAARGPTRHRTKSQCRKGLGFSRYWVWGHCFGVLRRVDLVFSLFERLATFQKVPLIRTVRGGQQQHGNGVFKESPHTPPSRGTCLCATTRASYFDDVAELAQSADGWLSTVRA
jgi:hypothetical protein